MKVSLPSVLLVLLTTLSFFAFADDTHVAGLTCDNRVNPIDVDDFTPLFSWKIKSTTRGQDQLAYQLMMGTSPDFTENSIVWNTGKVVSTQSIYLPYGGTALSYGKKYFWKAKVWTAEGHESGFSETAFWMMTIDPLKWQASWISAPVVFDLAKLNNHRYKMIRGETHDFIEPMPLLRKQFNLRRKISSAKAYISAPGFHDLFLNGKKVSDNVLDAAFTNYDKTVLYSVHDVTANLKQGDNAIGIMLGNGWYNSGSKEVWGFDKAPWRNYPTVKVQLEITYDDQSVEVVVSDNTWKATAGPILFTQVRQGEYYDARLEVARWNEAAIDEKKWQPVRIVAGPIGTLRPQRLPPVKVMKTFEVVESKKSANGNTVYDFGQNIAGFIAIKVNGRPGSRLQFKYAERIDSTGAVDQSNINNLLADSLFQVDRYTLKGNGDEIWSPQFVYHGFRYVEVSYTGEKPTILSITSKAIHTSFESAGEFSCSNELINQIQQSTRWSFRNNFVGFPTDCPQREKNGWTGDAQLACETGLTNFNASTSYQKWLGDLRDEQQPNGSLPGIVPTNGWGYYWGNGPAWDIACVVIPWSLYVYSGEQKVLSENYNMVKKYVDYMHSRSPELIADFGLNDWIPVNTVTPAGVTSTGYFYYGATVVSKMSAILGNSGDQKTYAQLAEKIKEAFNKKYLNAKDLTYANASQTALSCALFQGLVPEKYYAQVGKKLIESVHSKNDHIDCGILGARYIMHALSSQHQSALAFKIIANETYPGWGYWIRNGATTLWEDWKGESSLNHIMLGDVSSWFYKKIGGIQPDETAPGFRHFSIRPEIVGGLTWARSNYESVYGEIISSWRIENNKFIHEIEVPVNTTATYYPPVKTLKHLTENQNAFKSGDAREIKDHKGVGPGEIPIALKSGKYIFTMPVPK